MSAPAGCSTCSFVILCCQPLLSVHSEPLSPAPSHVLSVFLTDTTFTLNLSSPHLLQVLQLLQVLCCCCSLRYFLCATTSCSLQCQPPPCCLVLHRSFNSPLPTHTHGFLPLQCQVGGRGRGGGRVRKALERVNTAPRLRKTIPACQNDPRDTGASASPRAATGPTAPKLELCRRQLEPGS